MRNLEKTIFIILLLLLIVELSWLGYTYLENKKQSLTQEKINIDNQNKPIKIDDLSIDNSQNDSIRFKLDQAPEFNDVVFNYLDGTRKLNYINFFNSSYLTNIFEAEVIEVRENNEVKIKNPINGYQPIFQIVFKPLKEEIKDLTLNIYMNSEEYEKSSVWLVKKNGEQQEKKLSDIKPGQKIKVVQIFDLKNDNMITIYSIEIKED